MGTRNMHERQIVYAPRKVGDNFAKMAGDHVISDKGGRSLRGCLTNDVWTKGSKTYVSNYLSNDLPARILTYRNHLNLSSAQLPDPRKVITLMNHSL